MAGSWSIDADGRTDRGRVRPANEDHFLIGQLDKSLLVTATSLPLAPTEAPRLVGATEGQVFCVADGLGGHAAGERASATAVDTTTQYLLHTMPCFYRAQELAEHELRLELKAAVERAQLAVRRRAAAEAALAGMGTTLTLAFLRWPVLHLVHVGDSRCYLLRDRLRVLTTDHTLAQRLVEAGQLRPDEAAESLLAHSLWNAIGGGGQEVHIDITRFDLHPGDTLLLCTDGLVRHVTDDAIEGILRAADSAATAVDRLIAAANEGGGTDNITVIVARLPAVAEAAAGELRLAQDVPSPSAP